MKVVPMVLLVALFLGVLSACDSGPTANTSPGANSGGGGSANGQVNLTFWSWVVGVDKAAADFTKTHPNIHINVINVGGGPNEYNKLYTAIKANNEPDLAQIEYQLVPTFETTGSLATTSSAATRVRSRFAINRRAWTPYLFILPFGVLFILFFLIPIVYAIYQSVFHFQRTGLGLSGAMVGFTGLSNYVSVFSDAKFYASIGRMVLYGIVQVPIMLILALVIALVLDSTVVRFKPFFRLAFFVPYAVPGIIAALLWGYLYDPALSPIVKGLQAIDLPAPDFLGYGTVLWSIAIFAIWAWTGYSMLIIFAALQAIPGDIYESARMDGCSELYIAWYIKIPLVAPALVLTGIFSIIGTLQLFAEPQVLTAISNNISTSFTPVLYAYNSAFAYNNYYYAAALSVVLALVTFVFSFRGRDLIFATILGSILIPATALALPLYLMMSLWGMTNTIWSVLLPSLVSPFGVYLARIYAASSIPDELLEAARIDGANEFRTFVTVAMRLMVPALVTILLFQFVAIWTNFFLPLIMLSNPNLFPVTVGLQSWNVTTGGANNFLYPLIVTGALVSSIPLLIGCIILQRFWRGGLGAGSVKG
jgi:multiple sugar transport system permease protein